MSRIVTQTLELGLGNNYDNKYRFEVGADGGIRVATANNEEVLTYNKASKTWEGNIGIGAGQKWYELTDQRVKDVVYTNTTGRPIMLEIVMMTSVGSKPIYIDDVGLGYASSQANASSTLIIPDGSKYKCVSAFTLWRELR